MPWKKSLIFFFFVTVLFPAISRSQLTDLKFVNYENIPGLENRKNLIRDSSGYIWLSGNGLSRFDGIHIKVYQKNANLPNSLHSNNTNYLTVDKNGTMWLDAGGLCYYNAASDGFIYVNKSISRKDAYDEGIAYDKKETLWFTGDSGLCSININTLKITETSVKKYSFPNQIIIDNEGKIWLSTFSNNIIIYNPANNTYKKYFIYNHAGQPIGIRTIFTDKKNNIWIAKEKGIININPTELTDKNGNLKFEEAAGLQNISVASNITALTYLPSYSGDSILWIATYTHGLVAFNINTKKITANFLPDKNNPHAISSNLIKGLYADKDNHLWLLHSEGISMLNMYNQNFKSRILTELNEGPYSGIFSMAEDKKEKNIVWMGTNQGLLKYDWIQKKIILGLKSFDNSGAINSGDMVTDDGVGNLWIVSGNVLFKYSKKLNQFLKLPPPVTSKNFRYGTNINKIICMHDTVLIASNTGLTAYLDKKQQYKNIYSGNNERSEINSFNIFSMKQDADGTIWCVGAKGLIKIDLNNSVHTLFLFNDKQNYSGFNRLTGIDFDGDNIVIAASAGVVIFNKITKQFSKLSTAPDPALDNSWDVKVDGHHNYWFTTYYGLIFFNRQTKNHKVFTVADGLPRTFTSLPLELINNTIVGKYGAAFVYIDPYSVEKNTNIPQPVISDFRIFEKSILFDPAQIQKEPFNLTYKQNFISFDFNAFEFNFPDKVSFAYHLNGLEKDWVYCGDKRTATYTNLSGGYYTFEMKAANSNGLWSAPAVFKFYIKPAFWQTLWFKTISALFLIFTVYGFVKRRIALIRKEEEKKTATNKMVADLEMKALRSQMNPHFIFNSLNSIQKFIWDNKQEDASDYLSKFSKLIRMILEHSMHKLITLEQEVNMLTLYLELEHRRSSNKYDYTVHIDDTVKPSQTLVPPMIFQPYVENAIWHGLLHKQTRGRLTVNMQQQENDLLTCIIQDDGIGRRTSEMNKEKKENKSVSYGMQITEERLKIMEQNGMHGNVIIEDLYDKEMKPAGTKIIIQLPGTTFTKL